MQECVVNYAQVEFSLSCVFPKHVAFILYTYVYISSSLLLGQSVSARDYTKHITTSLSSEIKKIKGELKKDEKEKSKVEHTHRLAESAPSSC